MRPFIRTAHRHFLVAILIIAAGLPLPSGEARAALAVIDNSNLAQNAATAARTAEMLLNAQQQLTKMTSLLDAFGLKGAFEEAGDLNGVLRTSETVTGVLGGSGGLSGINAELSVLDTVRDVVGLGSEAASIKDVSSGIRFVERVLGTSRAIGDGFDKGSDFTTLISGRYDFHEKSAADAIGVSLYSRSTLEQSQSRIAEVASAAKAAVDLREQMAVNTAAILLVAEEIMQMRSVISALTQEQGAAFFRNNPPKGYAGFRTPPPADQRRNDGNAVFQSQNR